MAKRIDGQVHYHPKFGYYWPKLTSDNYENLASYGYEIRNILVADADTEVVINRELVEKVASYLQLVDIAFTQNACIDWGRALELKAALDALLSAKDEE